MTGHPQGLPRPLPAQDVPGFAYYAPSLAKSTSLDEPAATPASAALEQLYGYFTR